MKKDHSARLAAAEASIIKWQSRLARASNALQKALKQRRRLLAQGAVTAMTAPPGQKTPNQKAAIAAATSGIETDHISETDLPAFLDRRNPDGIRRAAKDMREKADTQLVDKLKAQRAAQVEADKHKMPLTGREALAAIRPKRKTKAAAP